MSHSQGPPGRRPSRRLSPDELAREVARRLKTGSSSRGGHRRRTSFDILTTTRILMVLGVVFLGAGAVSGVAWIGRVAGYETTGKMIETRPVFGCPGESELGAVFDGETVVVVGRSEDGRSYVLRDQRGPGGMAYVEAEAIDEVEDPDRLPVRTCEPRSASEVAAAEVSSPTTTPIVSTTSRGSTTTVPETPPITRVDPGSSRPPRRGTPGPGAPPTTSPAAPTNPTSPTTPGSTPTTPPATAPGTPGTSPTTAPTTTTTTTTTTTSPATTSTTTPETTTTTVVTTTTSESTTTTTTTTTTVP